MPGMKISDWPGTTPAVEITVRMRAIVYRRVDSQVLQYFRIDLVDCALTVWNSTPHSFNVRLEVLIFPSGLTGTLVWCDRVTPLQDVGSEVTQ